MPDKANYVTPEGLTKLREELQQLVHTRRRDIADRIQEAKELGDLSENAEYQEAKNEQAFNEGRIEEIETVLKNAVVIDNGTATKDVVHVGSVVKAESQGKPMTFTIVGSNEADPVSGKVSNESPIGQALLGKRRGETVTVTTPRGSTVDYTIAEIS